MSAIYAQGGPTPTEVKTPGGDVGRGVGLLAGLVARRGERARLLDETNQAGQWVDVATAVGSSQAFFVEVAPWILALDADSAETAVALEDLAGDLCEHGHRPVVVSSGQPGHRHLFAVLADEAHRSHWARLARQSGIDVRRHIRPPLSPHRLGLHVELVSPTSLSEAVEALSPPAQASGGRQLSTNMAALLRHGEHPGRSYSSRSEITQALATGALNANWSYPRFRNALTDPENDGGIRYRQMLHRDPTVAEAWLQRSWTKAETFIAKRPARRESSAPMIEVLESIRHQATTHRWTGRTASTDRAMLLALCDFAEAAGQINGFAAGIRAVGIEAGISSAATARRALRRLQAQGWINQLHQGSGAFASLWSLSTTPPLTATYPNSSELRETDPLPIGGCEKGGQVREVQRLDPGHDAFRWAAVGKSAGRVLEALHAAPEGLSVKELAAGVGMSPGGVWRTMQRLQAVQAPITRTKQGRAWRYRLSAAIDDQDLTAIAEAMGQAGRRHQERVRYLDEQAQRRRWNIHPVQTMAPQSATADRDLAVSSTDPDSEPAPELTLFGAGDPSLSAGPVYGAPRRSSGRYRH